jgi:HEAT repeat protein/type 1 glutamine amidotransferase
MAALSLGAAPDQAPARRGVSPEERQQIENALPAKAPARPRRPRKLLVVDAVAGRMGHPSVPHASLAVELMGARTGAYEAVVSHDSSPLAPGKLSQFDAVYLNNTIGDLFDTPELRESLTAFLRNGGGLVANHAVTATSPKWTEFGEILGARGAAHRAADEKVVVKLDDPAHPLNAAFGGQGFELTEEIFRFQDPSPRTKVHVLLSIDVARTDMNQGRCTSKCVSEDGEYPISWVRRYGQGRVFYTSLGHNPYVFWDARILRHFLAGIQFALGDLEADTRPSVAPAAPAAAGLEPILARIATYEVGQSRDPVAQLNRFVGESLESPALLGEIEARLIRFLQSGATAAGKNVAFRELSLVAGPASVPVLAGLLAREETAEMARYALARIPGPAADEALRKALGETSGKVRIGIINSLGQRGDAQSVPQLRALALSSDSAIAGAAVGALGGIASRPALEALAAARGKLSGPARQRASEAYLECAGRLAAGGDKGAALKVYQQLIARAEPEMVRVAALSGLAAVEGRNAAPALVAGIESDSTRVRDAAIRILNGLPGPEITAALVRQFPKLPASGQVRLVTALAGRGDASALPLLVQAAKGSIAEVREAALAGLGKLGDETTVTFLAEAAAAGQGLEQAAARRSLSDLPGPAVDAAIVAAIGSTTGKVRLELITAAGERGSTGAAGALVRALQERDPDVRRGALRALRSVGGAAEVPALLEALKVSEPADRREAAQALAAVLKRSRPAGAGSLISAYQAATALETRVALLEALGQASTPDALRLLRGCLADPNPEIARAAVLALSEWADPAPLPDLLAAAKSGASPALQVLALRGFLKLVALPSPRPHAESAGLLREAMGLAREPAEKRAVLSLLPAYPCPEALKLAEASAEDESVATEARLAVNRLRSALKLK